MAEAKNVIRVGLGSPDQPFSCVWRLWATRSECYVAVRSLVGLVKISLHKSGEWALAFTKESGAVFEDNRRGMTWTRPPEFAPGWTTGPSIAIPRLDADPPQAERPADKEPIRWLPPAAVGSARFLSLYFSRHGDMSPREVITQEFEEVGSLELANGERVWVLSSERPLTDEEKKPVLDIRKEVRIGVADATGVGLGSIIWNTTSPEGPPLFVEIVLGPDNFYAKEATEKPS